MKRLIPSAGFLLLMAILSATAAEEAVSVPRWEPRDFTFRIDQKLDSPFSVDFAAEATGPGGISLRIPGFYDGNGTWKVRLSPTIEGDWSLVTRSSLPALDNRKVTFRCQPNPSPAVHGGLIVDPDYPRHFVYEDGTRFYLLGYECDWLWALDLGKPDLRATEAFLDELATNGFNYILVNTYAHDTGWRKGRTGEDDFGPPAMYAWEGSNQKPDHSRFNLAYWRHYDRVIEAMRRRGIIAHVMIKVYNKMVKWPTKGSVEDDLFFRWVIARYAAYPNVHWDFSKESNNEKNLDYKLGRMKSIRDNDPYRRPISTHTDTATYNAGTYNDVLDFRSDQQHSKWRATILDHRKQHVWPVINTEFGYEHGPNGLDDKTYNTVQPPEEVCRRGWEVCTAGAYGCYYYTYTAWDVLRPQDNPPGYAHFKHLRDFFETTAYWRLGPVDGVAADGYCLAEPGKEYVVFLNNAAPLSLKLEGLAGSLKAQWYHPLTGERRDAGTLSAGIAELRPPGEWRDAPVVLHVGSAQR